MLLANRRRSVTPMPLRAPVLCRLALVFELMQFNLYELIRGRKRHLDPQLVRIYAWQMMRSVDYMHSRGVFHRDIKPENVLVESSYDVYTGLKLADFGS